MDKKEKKTHCNLCGNEFDLLDYINNFCVHTTVGYGSKYDAECVDLHFCCSCFDTVVRQCAINPMTGEREETNE